MKRAVLLVLFVVVGLTVLVSASYDLQRVIIKPDPTVDLEVKIWIDRGTGALYRSGEAIQVFFRTNKDAHIAIYNITADGQVHLLFPNAYDRDNFVRGGRDYSLPTPSASQRYRLQVGGAPGREILQIVASTEPLKFLDRLQPLIDQQGFAVAEEKAESFVAQRVIPIIEGTEYAVSTTYFFLDSTVGTGKASIRTTPSDAMVYINGAYVGRSPLTVDIDAGRHVVSVYKEGYRTETLTFTVRESRTEILSITLMPILRTHQLSVTSSPTGASVFIDGTFRGQTPLQLSLTQGTYTLRVERDGFRTYEERFTIDRNINKSVNLVPVIPTHQLSITSSPSGASVYIDGTLRGRTPLNISLLQGTYTLRVERDGYRTYEERFTIDRNISRSVSLVPVIPTHQLSITSSPSGASVYIDGTLRGRTPLNISLLQGTYTLRVEMDGYRTHEERFTIDRNTSRSVNLVPVIRRYSLTVRSSPSRAEVYIDGSYAGRTPLEISLAEGTYDVEITLSGYEDYSERVRLTTDRIVDATLTTRRATLVVRSDPTDARVLVDGRYVGNTPLEVRISELGRTSVRVEKEGYVTQTRDIVVSPGGAYTLDFRLEEERPVARISVRSTPTGARIFVNGYDHGLTNTTLTLDPGYYEIVLIKEGYRFSFAFRYYGRGDHSLEFKLIPIE